jgi:hypothetical protein
VTVYFGGGRKVDGVKLTVVVVVVWGGGGGGHGTTYPVCDDDARVI